MAAGAYVDAAGNAGGAGLTPSLSFDTLAPTVAITSDRSALKAGESATITFTFSEDPGVSFAWDGSSGDIVVTGGTLSAISGTGTVRTAVFTPAADTNTGTAGIAIASGAYADAAGNGGAAGAGPAIAFDTLVPVVAVTSDRTSLAVGETATITFTFSEDPGASFDAGDITVSGGTLGALGGTGLTRTAVFTPADGMNGGAASIAVTSGSWSDAAGNAGAPAAALALAFDTLAPAAPSAPVLLGVDDTGVSGSDHVTNRTTVTIHGTAEAGATVRLYDGATLAGSATADALGAWSIIVTDLAEGTHGLVATATDAAGNVSAASGEQALVVDVSAPTLSITSSASALKAGETATITFTFSEDPGATFAWEDIVVSGGTLGALAGTGAVRTATFTPAAGTNGGSASISVAGGAYTDAAGNNGASATAPVLTFDTLAPTLAITSDVAALKTGETATITFTFSEDPGATFTSDDLVVTGGTLGALAGTGTIRTAVFTPAAGVNGGAASISAAGGSYQDAAGNGGAAANGPALVFDTLAPLAPSAPALLAADDTGVSGSDNIVNRTTPTFTGTAEEGATVTLYDGATAIGSAVAVGGNWSITSPALAAGNHTITATATDVAGNVGPASAGLALVVDTGAPTLAITSSASALKAGETATITFTFSEDPGTTFAWDGAAGDIAVSGGTLGALTGTGNVRTAVFTPAAGVNAGTASISVSAGAYTDTAGNGGGGASAPALVFDTLAPTLAITSNATALAAGQVARITFTFSEDPGASFGAGDIMVMGGTLGAITGTGNVRTAMFTPDANTQHGTASISVAGGYVDAAGNAGGGASAPVLTFDTLAPLAPSAPVLSAGSDTGDLASDGLTADNTPTFSGTAENGATVTLYDSDGFTVIGTGVASGGRWTITTSPLANGIHTVTARATDAAGNASAPSEQSAITVDTSAPGLAISADTAALRQGQTATVTFTFSDDPGASFTLGDVQVEGGTLSALSGSGSVRTAVFTPLADSSGSASISVAAAAYADAAGNAGSGASLPALVFDTRAPTLTITSSAGALKAGETAVITFTFSEDPGASFGAGDINVSGGTLGGLEGTGNVRTAIFTPAANLNGGAASIAVAAGAYQDAAGNAGGPGAAAVLAIDTLAPAVAVSSDRASLKAGQTAVITFTFSEDPGDSFGHGDIVVSGGTLGALAGTGNVRTAVFTPTAGASGSAAISVANASYTDAAGNAGGAGLATLRFDTLAPAAPSAPVLAPGSDSGSSSTDGVTNATALTFTGTAEEGCTVVLVDAASGAPLGSAVATGGSWTITVHGMPEGAATVAAVATDAAGNASVRSGTATLTVDRSAPPALSLALAADSGAADGITNAGTVRVDGIVPGASWQYSRDGGASWTAGSGNEILVKGEGAHAVIARQVDLAGNTGPASAPLAFTLDTTGPTATVTLSDHTLVFGETATVTVTFSEAVTGFDAADITVANGTLGALASSDGGRTWTAQLTPALNVSDTSNVVSVSHAGVNDAAGNAGSGTSESANYSVATNGLRSVITLSDSELKAGETATVTISFNQRVSGFTASDLNVANGSLSGLTSADGGRTWTATLLPSVSTADATNVIALAHSSVRDASGAPGLGSSTSANYTVNTVRPTAIVRVGDKILAPGETALVTVQFSEAVSGFDINDLSVIGGSLSGLSSLNGGTIWTATLTASAVQGARGALPGYVKLDMAGVANQAGNPGSGYAVSTPYTVVPANSARVTVDGVDTYTGQVTLPATGLTGNVITIPSAGANRQDDPATPNSGLADIPVGLPAGGGTSLMVSLPVGAGLQAEGPSALLSNSQALLDLVARIESRTGSGSATQLDMTGAGSSFLGSLGQSTQVESHTVQLFADPGGTPGNQIVVSGRAPAAGGSPAIALVIDGSALPAGVAVQLDNVDFAAVVGDMRLLGGEGRNYVVGDGGSQNIYLGAEDDTLSGGAGNDFIGSAGGNDQLDGGDDDDLVVGGIGNDTVSGGAGNDILNGGRSTTGSWDFYVSASGAISARHSGAVFTASGTETVQAGELDAALPELAFLAANAEQVVGVALLYAALGRAPDLGGLSFWSRAGVSLSDVAAGVLRSAEWGSTPLGQAGDEAFVRGMYQDLLGREVDDDGLAFWMAALAGNSGVTRTDVLMAVALSTEHRDGVRTADGYKVGQAVLAEERGWFGGSGDDRLSGGAGNDQLVGGDGFDTAVFSGNRADYRILVGADDIVRVSHVATGDIDTLLGIEAAEFGDGSIDLSFLDAGQARLNAVGLLYQAVFDRAGDLAGLSWWLSLDASPAQLAQFFAATDEFQARYGSMDDAAFVQALYANSGLDAAAAGGMQAWEDFLATHTRAELVAQWIEQDGVVAAQFGMDGIWLL
ncbi:Ig-like domain-containing protein [Pseudoduganella sp. GCM10020061]|uniref:Ig-like domain-containing protein n=1 Tax=Pseudoduganella sp. GCM10020061 TaxID=3317345 RepID=UPI00363107C0